MQSKSPAKYYRVGIDIGGTKIKTILWNGKKILKSLETPTPQNKKRLENELKNIFKKLKPKNGADFSIGIAAAGVVKNTTLVFAPNIPKIKNFDFRKVFPENVSLAVDNDARAFLKAEIAPGSAKKTKRVFGLTVGTGVGRAFAKNGVVQKIKKFEEPEIWEKEYQKIRNKNILANFLGANVSKLAKKYESEIIVVGGGLGRQKNFFNKFASFLRINGIKGEIRRSKLGKYAAAIGASLLSKRINS